MKTVLCFYDCFKGFRKQRIMDKCTSCHLFQYSITFKQNGTMITLGFIKSYLELLWQNREL